MIARHAFEAQRALSADVGDLWRGLGERQAVVQAVVHLMASVGSEQAAYAALRAEAKPDLLIADEPTTALDVTVQREVLELLRDLQNAQGTAILLITHDMGVVAEMADRVVIMRKGQIEETGPVDQIFADPQQPYTRDLLAAVPRMGQSGPPTPRKDAPVIADLRDVQVRCLQMSWRAWSLIWSNQLWLIAVLREGCQVMCEFRGDQVGDSDLIRSLIPI